MKYFEAYPNPQKCTEVLRVAVRCTTDATEYVPAMTSMDVYLAIEQQLNELKCFLPSYFELLALSVQALVLSAW